MKRELNEVSAPVGGQFTISGPPKKPFQDRISGRIVIGIGCSSAVFVGFNFGGIKDALRWVFTVGHTTMGDPKEVEAAKRQAADALKEIKEAVKQNQPAQLLPIHLPTTLNPVKAAGNAISNKVDQKIDDVKHEVIGALTTLSPAVKAAQEALAARQERNRLDNDAKTRVEAKDLGIEFDETTPIEDVRAKVNAIKSSSAQVKLEAFREWWDANGPNGYCPKGHPMRVSRSGNAVHTCRRRGCGAHAKASDIRAAGDPPMPRKFPDDFELWWARQ